MTRRQSSAVDKAIRYLLRGHTLLEACARHGIAQSTLYRACKRLGIEIINGKAKEPK